MKKNLFIGFLLVMAVLSHYVLAETSILIIPINGTFTFPSNSAYAPIGAAVPFHVSYPVDISIGIQVQGGPPNSVFMVRFLPVNNGCGYGNIKINGNCYPANEGFASNWGIGGKLLQENGPSWKAQAMLAQAPKGSYFLHGKIIVTFKPHFTPAPLK